MIISFDLPRSLEGRVRADGVDLGREAMEAYLADLYRRERISHDDLSEALGYGFHETQQFLKDHGVGDDFTLDEFEAERDALRGLSRR